MIGLASGQGTEISSEVHRVMPSVAYMRLADPLPYYRRKNIRIKRREMKSDIFLDWRIVLNDPVSDRIGRFWFGRARRKQRRLVAETYTGHMPIHTGPCGNRLKVVDHKIILLNRKVPDFQKGDAEHRRIVYSAM